ncbi:hypothetical protein GGGNBK_13550 [Sporosarcina sp. ANT_H38]
MIHSLTPPVLYSYTIKYKSNFILKLTSKLLIELIKTKLK